jgi:uncharacterized protein (DUF111 family)
MILYVDVIGGAAGDMLLAGLIDAGAPLGDVQMAVDAVVPGRFRVGIEEVRRGGFRARLLVAGGAEGGELAPRPIGELLAAVEGAALSDPVKVRAQSVLMRLGEAEARVHGIALAGLSVHELGDDDTCWTSSAWLRRWIRWVSKGSSSRASRWAPIRVPRRWNS